MFDNNTSLGFGAAFGLVIAAFVVYLVWQFLISPLAYPAKPSTQFIPPNTVTVYGQVTYGPLPSHHIYAIAFSNVGDATFNPNGNYTISVPNGHVYTITEYWEYNDLGGLVKGQGSCEVTQPLTVKTYNSTMHYNIPSC